MSKDKSLLAERPREELEAEILALKAQLAEAPAARETAPATTEEPVYQDTDDVPQWVTPSEMCGFRLDEAVTVGSEKGKARTFRPGAVYRDVPFGIIRQALALWGAYASGRNALLVNRGNLRPGSHGDYLGELEV